MNEEKAMQIYNPETVELIKTTVMPKDATPQELELYLYQAKRTGLDALSRQIYCIKTGGKLSIQATIDGFRLIAERSGKYAGQMPPMWCGLDGIWVDVWLSKTPPVAAKVGVYRTDFKEPLIAVAKFDTYAQRKFDGKLNFTWDKMPDLMLSKCAEALALRKAFPQELSGLYTNDEMNNFTEPEPVKSEAKEQDPDSPYFKMQNAKTLDEVKEIWDANKDLKKVKAFSDLKEKMKNKLSEIKVEDIIPEDPMPYEVEKPKLKTVEDYKVILADCVILQQLQQTYKEFVFEGLTLADKEKVKIYYKERVKELS